MAKLPTRVNEFSDIFVGGGSILLEVAKQHPKAKLRCNDLDKTIFSFWDLISRGDIKSIKALKKLISVEPTVKLFEKLRKEETKNEIELAYRAVFFNRTTFSGIATSGPIGGYEQKSKWTIGCRYNTKRLIDGIDQLVELMKDRLVATNHNFVEAIWHTTGPMYLDPPYYEKGKELYPHFMTHDEHVLLSQILSKEKHWILSYDDCPEIRRLYSFACKEELNCRYSISGEKTKWAKKPELLITPNENKLGQG